MPHERGDGELRVNMKTKRIVWYLLLLGVITLALWAPLYNRLEPTLWGIPFFYWFQFVLVIVAAVLTGLAYRSRI